MANPVVHFEITGSNPAELRAYYKELFGWESETDPTVASEVSEPGQYGFINAISANSQSTGIPGGIGGGASFQPKTLFYVGVPDVEAALQKCESLGGRRVLGPVSKSDGSLVIAHFADPEGNIVGLAGPK